MINAVAIDTRRTPSPPRNVRRIAAPQGLGLIELLVALTVLATALLAIAQWQQHSLLLLRDAQFHDAAQRLAADMAERIRANPSAARTGAYELPFERVADTTTACAHADCAPAAMAAWDLSLWRTTVAQTLPNGRSRIEAHDDAYRIVIAWTPLLATPGSACAREDLDADDACLAQVVTP